MEATINLKGTVKKCVCIERVKLSLELIRGINKRPLKDVMVGSGEGV